MRPNDMEQVSNNFYFPFGLNRAIHKVVSAFWWRCQSRNLVVVSLFDLIFTWPAETVTKTQFICHTFAVGAQNLALSSLALIWFVCFAWWLIVWLYYGYYEYFFVLRIWHPFANHTGRSVFGDAQECIKLRAKHKRNVIIQTTDWM